MALPDPLPLEPQRRPPPALSSLLRVAGMTRPRYPDATLTRLPALLPGMQTAMDGKGCRVMEIRERDNGDWVAVLDMVGGKVRHVGGPAECVLPVFTGPYPVCSCHGDPWPCDDAWQRQNDASAARRQSMIEMYKCAACGQEHNLGPVRYFGGGSRRYCRRVGCVREAERAIRDFHNKRVANAAARQAFAAQMEGMFNQGGTP